jgi:hypothetical protein
MSVLDALDATRICARSTVAPDAWTRPVPVAIRREIKPAGDYSWRALLRNPQALLLTGMVSTVMVKDAVLRSVAVRATDNAIAPRYFQTRT